MSNNVCNSKWYYTDLTRGENNGRKERDYEHHGL